MSSSRMARATEEAGAIPFFYSSLVFWSKQWTDNEAETLCRGSYIGCETWGEIGKGGAGEKARHAVDGCGIAEGRYEDFFHEGIVWQKIERPHGAQRSERARIGRERQDARRYTKFRSRGTIRWPMMDKSRAARTAIQPARVPIAFVGCSRPSASSRAVKLAKVRRRG